ncbi:MAG: UDP-N-acetylmuramoyl-L-alanine--D-glutamate ligase [Steroidobacteraceae bacterium]
MKPTTHQERAIVVGLGDSGLSVLRYLDRRDWRLLGIDTRTQPPARAQIEAQLPRVQLDCGRLDPARLEPGDLVVVAPGLRRDGPFFARARELQLEIIGDIELFARDVAAPVIAVTGTNGKSTVTSLTGAMARRAGRRCRAGGNLGPPALELLDDGPQELFVLELSSYQLETTDSLRPIAATVLNISPDHLDRYATLADYAAAKATIYRHAEAAVINLDDPLSRELAPDHCRTLGFSIAGARDALYTLEQLPEGNWLCRDQERLIGADELRIRGLHNAANALAALALGEAAGLPITAMVEELRHFAGLAHRAEFVATLDGVAYINDSKGTNVGATIAAIAGLPGRLVLIAGGDGKGQDFAPLAAAARGRLRHALLIGRDARAIANVLAGICPVQFCASLEDAVHASRRLAERGDTVLLSPACASFDMFRNYADRGQRFRDAVMELAA